MKNKYIGGAKLSEAKFRDLLRCFCLELDAGQIASLIRANRNTVNRYLRLIRGRICRLCEMDSPFGKRHDFQTLLHACRFLDNTSDTQAAAKGPPALGASTRDGSVFTEILPDFFLGALLPVIQGRSSLGGLGYPLRFRGYETLMHFGCRMPYFLESPQHSSRRAGDRGSPLEGFWFFSKRRIRKFQGIPRSTFNMHLKECEFRFNHRGNDIYSRLLQEFRGVPLLPGTSTRGIHFRKRPSIQGPANPLLVEFQKKSLTTIRSVP